MGEFKKLDYSCYVLTNIDFKKIAEHLRLGRVKVGLKLLKRLKSNRFVGRSDSIKIDLSKITCLLREGHYVKGQ